MTSRQYPGERRDPRRARVAATAGASRSYSSTKAPGMDCEGSDLALADEAVYVIGNDATGMVLVKYYR